MIVSKYFFIIIIAIILVLLTILYLLGKHTYELFQDNYRVVISLTTSPKRIENIETTLQSITNDQTRKPDKVYLNLPIKFARTNESYTIPDFVEKYPLVFPNQVPIDEGPITKLTPAVRLEKDPSTIIIIVDDDSKYDPMLVERLLDYYKNGGDPNSVVANHCRAEASSPVKTPCELPEGFAGVAFPRGIFKDDFDDYVAMSIRDNACMRADDLIIGNYLEKHNIPRITLHNEPQTLWFAKQEDALSIIDQDGPDRYKPCRDHLRTNSWFAFG